jgi:hypothetical protein
LRFFSGALQSVAGPRRSRDTSSPHSDAGPAEAWVLFQPSGCDLLRSA